MAYITRNCVRAIKFAGARAEFPLAENGGRQDKSCAMSPILRSPSERLNVRQQALARDRAMEAFIVLDGSNFNERKRTRTRRPCSGSRRRGAAPGGALWPLSILPLKSRIPIPAAGPVDRKPTPNARRWPAPGLIA